MIHKQTSTKYLQCKVFLCSGTVSADARSGDIEPSPSTALAVSTFVRAGPEGLVRQVRG